MKITFLGTGTSHGVPSLDCMIHDYSFCPSGVCKRSQTDKKHRRTRSSLLITSQNKNILIDITPDFRYQALREKIKRIDSILLTHAHADHIGGIPDIRSYTRNRRLFIYGSQESIRSVKETFSYIFKSDTFVGGGIPDIGTCTVREPFELLDLSIQPVPVVHGPLKGCFGYRIGDVGYIPDVKTIPGNSMDLLKSVKVLILNCLRKNRTHSTHLTLSESMKIARELSPEKCYFIHMACDIDYEFDTELLEPWMQFSYDGLTIKIDQ
ncbi:MBL fold metallo-hydrolase [Chitinispirillales bacterium ANBcel5]|uniref:MBL fold metallo-hydrolase n=1 Tax=Cellulosispirillum alkaliphilum TaxID=3039283 RepID=UPI002A543848|nr:MBL fold metallo-hydrolase [Chitinispirillales bacterium ANBcel5]